jgi:hypothetical protein
MPEPTRRLRRRTLYGLAAAIVGVVVLVVAVVVFSSSGSTKHPAGSKGAPAATKVPVPETGAYWGIYRDPNAYLAGASPAQHVQVIETAEAEIGRKFDYDRQFYRWGDDPFAADPTPNDYLKWSSTTGGHIMDVNLVALRRGGGFVPWAQIASGSQDDYLRTLAVDIRDWGKPAFFTFQHEPESLICPHDVPCDTSTRYYGTTSDYKAAWRHIVDVFRAAGVTNLSYVWQTGSYRWSYPTDYRFGPNNYPGSDVVDWIAVDPFNRGTPKWQDMSTMIQPWYAWASKQGKPLMIGAFGTVEDRSDPNRRAQWFAHARDDLVHLFPKVHALMYFDNDPSGTPVDDWRLFDGNAASLAAYKAWGLDPYFNTRKCTVAACTG